MTLRLGSLFSGYGGLEMGIAQVVDVAPVWHSEFDAAPSRILEQRFPGVPNLGDVTKIDWAAAPPVDVLCGGFPCQDVSGAGLRAGLRPGTRSGLWVYFAEAIDALRPRLVVIENVRGLLSAAAHSAMEPDAWDLGGPERERRPALRALGAVLGDLADIGYGARWLGVRAADAGAPHGRFRVFVLAYPAQDADLESGGQRRAAASGFPEARRARPDLGGRSRVPASNADRIATGQSTSRAGRPRGVGGVEAGPGQQGHCDGAGTAPDGVAERGDPADRGWSAAPDADCERHGGREDARLVGRVDGPDAGAARERERPRGEPRDRSAASRDWGVYGPAVERWKSIVGRVAPDPTEAGPKGGAALSPRFVEWMMGLPDGHVTDVGLSRREQLKALGNGVVPQQAALALRTLLHE